MRMGPIGGPEMSVGYYNDSLHNTYLLHGAESFLRS